MTFTESQQRALERLGMLKESTPQPEWSLDQAQDWVALRLDEGVTCPCCTQYARRYRRKLSSGIARAVVWLRRLRFEAEEGYVHISRIVSLMQVSPEMSKAEWWGLVESKPSATTAGKKNTGFWRLTKFGAKFVENEARVPKYAVVYDGVCTRLEGEMIGIKDAAGDHFDYDELMKEMPGE